MIEPFTYFLAVLLCIPLSHFVSFRWRPLFVSALGLFVFFALAPSAGLFIIFVVLQAYLLIRILVNLEKSNKWRRNLPYLLLINLFWVDFHSILFFRILETVGISFALLRIYMTVREILAKPEKLNNKYLEWIFVSAFYLPAILIGPVFSGTDLHRQVQSPEIKLGSTSFLYRNLVFGFVLTAFVTPMFTAFATDLEGKSSWLMPLYMGLLFIKLFAAFWGQSLIAEMGSRIMGLSIPANFNKPWLAKNIQEFWKRWHMSFSTFLSKYLFKPLVRKTGSVERSVIITFLGAGIWHEVAPGYILWGIFHGILMAYWPKFLDNSTRFRRFVSNMLTIAIVIFLSYLANYGFKQGFILSKI